MTERSVIICNLKLAMLHQMTFLALMLTWVQHHGRPVQLDAR